VADSIEIWVSDGKVRATGGSPGCLRCVVLYITDEALRQLCNREALTEFLLDASKALETRISDSGLGYSVDLLPLRPQLQQGAVAGELPSSQPLLPATSQPTTTQRSDQSDASSTERFILQTTNIPSASAFLSGSTTTTTRKTSGGVNPPTASSRVALSKKVDDRLPVSNQPQHQPQPKPAIPRATDVVLPKPSIICIVQSSGRRQLPHTPIVRQEIARAILSVPLLKGFRPTCSDAETAMYLGSICEYFAKGSHLKRRPMFNVNCARKSDGDLRRAYLSMLSEIPTISERRAMIIISIFPTLDSLLAAVQGLPSPISGEPAASVLHRLENAAEFGETRRLGPTVTKTLKEALLLDHTDLLNEFL
jgi:hypothetical protein